MMMTTARAASRVRNPNNNPKRDGKFCDQKEGDDKVGEGYSRRSWSKAPSSCCQPCSAEPTERFLPAVIEGRRRRPPVSEKKGAKLPRVAKNE